MRLLLDECVPRKLGRLLPHSFRTVPQMRWSGLKNGELLSRVEGQFEVFITSDQNLLHQQHLAGRTVAILVLSTNDLQRLESASQLIIETLSVIKTGEIRELEIP